MENYGALRKQQQLQILHALYKLLGDAPGAAGSIVEVAAGCAIDRETASDLRSRMVDAGWITSVNMSGFVMLTWEGIDEAELQLLDAEVRAERSAERRKLLVAVYRAAGGRTDSIVDSNLIANQLGILPSRSRGIVDRLKHDMLIKGVMVGGVSLTRAGVEEVESGDDD